MPRISPTAALWRVRAESWTSAASWPPGAAWAERGATRATSGGERRLPAAFTASPNWRPHKSPMPSLPKHPCNSPRCTTLCDAERYCPDHRRQKQRHQDKQRGTSAERGYDADHRRLRVLCFIRDEWRCVDCGWEPNIVTDFQQFELGSAAGRAGSRRAARAVQPG